MAADGATLIDARASTVLSKRGITISSERCIGTVPPISTSEAIGSITSRAVMTFTRGTSRVNSAT
jgi:hypothetical protein